MRTPRPLIPVEQWKDQRQRRGWWGERIAMAYLTRAGWSVEAHRFRLGHRELDLVVRRGAVVAFVEVKTRLSLAWGTPSESVRWRKRRTIVQVAEVWRQRHGRAGEEYRFDVIAVRLERGGRYRVEHLEDAWRC
jgi:putative endonuclease